MKKSDLQSAWLMGLVLCFIWIILFLVIEYLGAPKYHVPSLVSILLFIIYPAIIIGGLLIETLREKDDKEIKK